MRNRPLPWSSLLLLMLALPAPAAEPPKPGNGIHYVYLIRHGIYDPDTSRMTDDFASNGLNALGDSDRSIQRG